MNFRQKLKHFVIILNFLFHIQQDCFCLKLFKDRMQVITEVNLRPNYLNGNEYNKYYSEEYIDVSGKNRVSSMKLLDVWADIGKIYYNDVREEKLIEYDETTRICKSISSIEKMPFQSLRSIMVKMLPTPSYIEKYTSVALGPSLLLYGIQESLERFRYVTSVYNEMNLALVDVYERVLYDETIVDASTNKCLLIYVKVLSKDNGVIEKTSKHKLADSAYRPVDMLSISMFHIDKSYYRKQRLDQMLDLPVDSKVAEIEFEFVSEITGGTLIGQDLDKTKEFNYNLNPFMQPVGIGCWDQDEGCSSESRFYAPSLQFSAQYKTVNGSSGLSYVAFDGYRKILRLDKNGRKSIYDLQQELSYHIGKYNLFEKEKSDLLERSHNCIVMNYDTKVIKNNIMLKRLLGISQDRKACHLGSKVVDHISYNVYELELDYGQSRNKLQSKLPILLEASRFLLPSTFSSNKRYFLTYYVESFPIGPDTNGFDKFANTGNNNQQVNIPKFIELWESNSKDDIIVDRRLINRLEFTEFSWSLDVEPSGDSQSKDLSNLFNIKSCSYERSHELQLRYRLSSYESLLDKSNRKFSKALRRNPQLFKEILHDNLAKQLDIPLLNIVDLNIIEQDNANSFWVDSKIIELYDGVMSSDELGFARYLDIVQSLEKSILNIDTNSDIMDDCKLASLAEPKRNTLMFCEGLTLCVLFKEEDVSAFIPNLKKNSTKSNTLSQDFKEAECLVAQFNWAKLVREEHLSVLKRADDNYHRLIGTEVVFKFRYKENEKSKSEVVEFRGFTHAVDLKALDPQGLYNPRKALNGLRYTTMKEEPSSINMNLAFKLNYFNHNIFKYCQAACQLDEYCLSFSICSRKNVNSIRATDCILSSVLLNPERIKDLEQYVRNNNNGNNNSNPKSMTYKVTTYSDSQEFVLKQDEECSIHPKDTLLSYKMSSILKVKSNKTLELNGVEQQPKDLGIITTLEDCADQDFESSEWNNLGYTNFTYCPLGSICILEDDDVFKLANNQRCYLYEKSHTQFYDKRKFMRMSIQFDNDQMDIDTSELAKSFMGLTAEQCARDCNLLKSKCLSFDICKVEMSTKQTTMCYLYSIRSSFAQNQNKLIGYLDHEKQFFKTQDDSIKLNGSIKFTSTTQCDHYFLNDIYFNIRLSQLKEPSETDREKANNLELDLLNEDKKKSDDILNNGSQTTTLNQAKASGSGGKLNFLLLLIGTLMGSLGFLYGGQVLKHGGDLFQYLRARRSERMVNPRISQLGLTNNLEI